MTEEPTIPNGNPDDYDCLGLSDDEEYDNIFDENSVVSFLRELKEDIVSGYCHRPRRPIWNCWLTVSTQRAKYSTASHRGHSD